MTAIYNVATFLGKKFYFEVFRMVAKKIGKFIHRFIYKFIHASYFPLIKL